MQVKYLLIALVVLFVIGVVSSSGYARIDHESIVGIWLFDEGEDDVAGDSSGNGNDGILKGNLEWVDGKFSTAVSFPGIRDNSVSVPHSDTMSLDTFTITAWVNLEKMAFQTVVGKYDKGDDANYDIQVRSNGCVKTWIFCGGQGVQAMGGDVVVADSEWHHIACVCDETRARVYVDGGLKGETPMIGPPDKNSSPLTIGGSVINSYQGLIDEVGLFNVALAEDDIKIIMTEGLEKAIGLAPVSPADMLITAWAGIKAQN